ncbi:class I SAM-dependent methyltransferase [Enterococcus caccae]|uniref:Methyltransferase domain-containing protein n=1 Tax=Enterococcus caccae ATCC BAA-1240 TaxID=1158612 RepID=R3WVX7_9ENTE|nr:class I SAM-dependent methyltransferase [Enterococcus caccae]EOL45945.1 hypothetical protein UC7_01742 [Enterococcus caccae ATCC BAA-1240]EOT61141.1 hypothetical protein I580_02043 [Enterococcus caccae ATCC BAA-1240]
MMSLWNVTYLPLVKWAMSNVSLNMHSVILDIGVGNEASSAYLLQQITSSSVTGIDFPKAAISQANKKIPR